MEIASALRVWGREGPRQAMLGVGGERCLGSKQQHFMKTRLLCCSLGQRRGWSPPKGCLNLHRSLAQAGRAGWDCQTGLCCSCRGTGGTGWVAEAGMFPACLCVPSPASPGSQEQTGTEGHICLINDCAARPAQ